MDHLFDYCILNCSEDHWSWVSDTSNILLDNMKRSQVPLKRSGTLCFVQSLYLRVNQNFIKIPIKISPRTKWKTLKSESSSSFDETSSNKILFVILLKYVYRTHLISRMSLTCNGWWVCIFFLFNWLQNKSSVWYFFVSIQKSLNY